MSAPAGPLLAVEDLAVTFSTRHGPVEALKGVSLSLSAGETLGIVGESGSGKSITALTAMGLLERTGRVTRGRIRFAGEDITRAPGSVMRALRGDAMSMIFQSPRTALNPIRTIGLQIADALRAHRDLSAKEARARALDLLKQVLIRDPERRIDAYPHELSGGMCQRVVIAAALACEPKLLIADEPTTGLDVTTQKTVMDLLARLTRERGMATILITHDLGLAAQYCGQVTVMERGRIVETGAPDRLFRSPREPYTRRLVAASPGPASTVESLTPDRVPALPVDPVATQQVRGAGPLLEVQNVTKRFGPGAAAVDDVSFRLARGESLGLVGESGSGKSTLSRLVCRLLDQTEGRILFDGEPIGSLPARHFHRSAARREIQIVFQDPTESLTPRYTAAQAIADPLRTMVGLRGGAALRARVTELADQVGLPLALLDRLPHQLSGGQKARVGIARAIASRPRLLVLDEPTAALDVSVQAIVLQLLDRLRRETGMAYLFVSHDLNVVRMMCERTVVLRAGRIVEEGPSRRLFEAPREAYTRDLVAAIPHFIPQAA